MKARKNCKKEKLNLLEIQPNALLRLGLNKYYLFTRMWNFNPYRDHIDDAPIGCAAIYGSYDLVWYSVEEAWEFLALRLNAWCPQDFFHRLKLENKDCIRVKGTLKFRGRILAEVNDSGHPYYKLDLLDHLDVNALRESVSKAYSLTQDAASNIKVEKELLKKGILYDDIEELDIKLSEAREGKSEFLVLVAVEARELIEDPKDEFERQVVSTELMPDERVRTIESCEQVFPSIDGLVQAHYVLHIVGYLSDISEILFDRVQRKAVESGLSYRTTVMPVAMHLSRPKAVALSETCIQDEVSRSRVLEVIQANIHERSPFVVKRLDIEELTLLLRIWHNAARWNEHRTGRETERLLTRAFSQQLARCIYYIAYVLLQEGNNISRDVVLNMWYFCGAAFREVVADVEGLLIHLLDRKRDEVGSDFARQLERAWYEICKGGEMVKELPVIERMSFGTLLRSVIYWNKFVDTESQIGDKVLTETLKSLQACNFGGYRDFFTHRQEEAAHRLERYIRTKKDVKRMVNALDRALQLLSGHSD